MGGEVGLCYNYYIMNKQLALVLVMLLAIYNLASGFLHALGCGMAGGKTVSFECSVVTEMQFGSLFAVVLMSILLLVLNKAGVNRVSWIIFVMFIVSVAPLVLILIHDFAPSNIVNRVIYDRTITTCNTHNSILPWVDEDISYFHGNSERCLAEINLCNTLPTQEEQDTCMMYTGVTCSDITTGLVRDYCAVDQYRGYRGAKTYEKPYYSYDFVRLSINGGNANIKMVDDCNILITDDFRNACLRVFTERE